MSDEENIFFQTDLLPGKKVELFRAFEDNILDEEAPNFDLPEALRTEGQRSRGEFPSGAPTRRQAQQQADQEDPKVTAARVRAAEILAEAEAIQAQAAEKQTELQRREEELRQKQAELEETARQAARQAGEIQEEARQQAEKLIEEARHQTDRIEAEAYQAGFAKGEEAGKSLSEQKTASILRTLEAVVQSARQSVQQLLDDSQEQMVRLVYAIAEELIHREIANDPSVVLDIVRQAIGKIQQARRLTLYVSPSDFKFLEGSIEKLRGIVPEETDLNIEVDQNMQRGGCRIVSDTGEVEASVDKMLLSLRNQIFGD